MQTGIVPLLLLSPTTEGLKMKGNKTVQGSTIASGHQTFVRAILDESDVTLESKGKRFYNENDFPPLVWMLEFTEWHETGAALGRDKIESLGRKALGNLQGKNRIVIASTPEQVSREMMSRLDGGIIHEALHSLYTKRGDSLDYDRLEDILDKHYKPNLPYRRKAKLLKTFWNIYEDTYIERCGVDRYKGAQSKLQSVQELVWEMEKWGRTAHPPDGQPIIVDKSGNEPKIVKDITKYLEENFSFVDPDQVTIQELQNKIDRKEDAELHKAWRPIDHLVQHIRDRCQEAYLTGAPFDDYLDEAKEVAEDNFGHIIEASRKTESTYDTMELAFETLAILDDLSDYNKQQQQRQRQNKQQQGEGQQGQQSSSSGQEGQKKVKSDSDGDSSSDIDEDELEDMEEGEGQTEGDQGDDEEEEDGDQEDGENGSSGSDSDSEDTDEEGEGQNGGDESGGEGESDQDGDEDGESESDGSSGDDDSSGEGEDGDDAAKGGDDSEEGSDGRQDEGEQEEGKNTGTGEHEETDAEHERLMEELEEAEETSTSDDEIRDALEKMYEEEVTNRTRQLPNPYTTEYDKVEEVEPGWNALEKFKEFRDKVKSEIQYLRPRMLKIFRGEDKSRIRHGQESGGRLSSRTVGQVAYADDPKPFARKEKNENKNSCCQFILDESNSMSRGDRVETAQKMMVTLSLTVGDLQIPHEAFGFSTGNVNPVRKEHGYNWADDAREMRDIYTRFDNCRFRVFRDFDDPFSPEHYKRMMNVKARGYTPLPAAIRFGAERILQREEEQKIMMVVTDGYPQLSDWTSMNASDYLRVTGNLLEHLKDMGIHVIMIGIEEDYVNRYENSIVIRQNDSVSKRMTGFLQDQIRKVKRQ